MQESIPAQGNKVPHGPALSVEIAAEEQDLIVTRPAIESVNGGRHERSVRSRNERQAIGNDLEDIVPFVAEKQVAGLTV